MYSFRSMGSNSGAIATARQGAIALVAVATLKCMNPTEIQRYRKRRLRELIDAHFEGVNVQLAKKLRNKHGEALKDGSYVGHLLLPVENPKQRPIDEDRVMEIEGLRPAFKGWFTLPRSSALADSTDSAIGLVPGYSGAGRGQIVPLPLIQGDQLELAQFDNKDSRTSALPTVEVPVTDQIDPSQDKVITVHIEIDGLKPGDRLIVRPTPSSPVPMRYRAVIVQAQTGETFLAEYKPAQFEASGLRVIAYAVAHIPALRPIIGMFNEGGQ